MTMEDVAELAWHVQQYGLTAEALRMFERERIPRVSRIVKKAQVRRCSLFLAPAVLLSIRQYCMAWQGTTTRTCDPSQHGQRAAELSDFVA